MKPPSLVPAPMLAGLCAAVLVLLLQACARDDPHVIRSGDRGIRIPAPPGMRFGAVTDDGEARVFFSADTLMEQRHYTGIAWIAVHGEAAAESSFAERSGRSLGAEDTLGTARWRWAMADALIGSQAPLPEGPDMHPLIERIPMPGDAVAELAFVQAKDQRWVVGDGILKTGGRAVILKVLCRRPRDHTDLVRVRKVLVDWIQGIRMANAVKKPAQG